MRLLARSGTFGRDVQLALLAFGAGLVTLGLRLFILPDLLVAGLPLTWFLIPLVLVSVGLALRRVAPLVGLALATVALAIDLPVGASLATTMVFTQVLYEVCVHGPPWLWRWALLVTITLTLVSAAAMMIATRSVRGASIGVFGALVLVLPVVSAVSVRQYRDQASAERARAAAERQRAAQATRMTALSRRQAVIEERTRMARELHDVIANQLSAVAIHSSALLSVPDLDQETVTKALRVIRENSVQGLAEMRQMIELLRDPGPESARLGEADRLAEQARQAGLAVHLDVRGEPRPLPAEVDLAAFRIVQESLTNALKHGAGQVSVRIDYGREEITLAVRNPIGDAAPVVPGSGVGLVGMRERVDLLGGTLTAGPRVAVAGPHDSVAGPPGGAAGPWWHVEAALPLEPSR